MMRRLFLALWLLAAPAAAQTPASLVADRITVTAAGALVAEGNVTAFHDGTRLEAGRITYDPATDRLTLDGPVTLVTAAGDIMTADAATLSPGLRDGILRGARLILDRRLQLAAARIDRVEGRLTALTQVAATSCAVCGDRPPLWEIRAARVVHDTIARQIHFADAVLRVRGLPVLWLPRLRLPDPTLDRATGFLVPDLRSGDLFGVVLRLPYFIRLGESADLTVTPWLSAGTRTVEARWRRAFATGAAEVRGMVSEDDIRPGDLRWTLAMQGAFALPGGATLRLDVQSTSDPDYLRDYGLSDRDRLPSTVALERVRPDGTFRLDLTAWQSLRADETFASLPPLIGRADWDRHLPAAGGTLTLRAGAAAWARGDAPAGPEARDVLIATAGARWHGARVLGPGLIAAATGSADVQAWATADDPGTDAGARILPAAQVSLRWPLVRRGAGGAVQVIEPVMALSWTGAAGATPPAEQSLRPALDEGNVLSLFRLPGRDGTETGAAAAAGLTWMRIGPAGDRLRLTLARAWREVPLAAPATSGLGERASDWVLSGAVDLNAGLSAEVRSLLDDTLAPTRTEARLSLDMAAVDLAAGYVWLPADAEAGRAGDVSEWTVDGAWDLSDRWSLRAAGRYDLAAGEPARASFGATWRNECVTVDLSLSRRYTGTDDGDPATDIGLSVALGGFSAGAAGPPAACR